MKRFVLFVLAASVLLAAPLHAQLEQEGVFALLGFTSPSLSFVPTDAAAEVVPLGELPNGAHQLKLIDQTLYVVVADDFVSGSGGALAWASITEMQEALEGGEAIGWQTLSLDGENPWDVVRVDNRLIVSLQMGYAVVAYDRDDPGTELWRVSGMSAVQGLATDGEHVLGALANFTAGTEVAVIDPGAGTLLETIPVGTNPSAITLDGEGRFHVLCTGDYDQVSGSAWRLERDGEGVYTAEEVTLGGNPWAIQAVPTTPEGPRDRILIGDEYAFDSPHYYAYDAATLQLETPAFDGMSGGWSLAAGDAGYYAGSSVTGELHYHDLETDQTTTCHQFIAEVVSLACWSGGSQSSVPEEEAMSPPATVELSPAWPNPFNATARLRVMNPERAPVELFLVNTLGRRVSTLHSGTLPRGGSEVIVRADGLPSGVYWVVAKRGAARASTRITLVR